MWKNLVFVQIYGWKNLVFVCFIRKTRSSRWGWQNKKWKIYERKELHAELVEKVHRQIPWATSCPLCHPWRRFQNSGRHLLSSPVHDAIAYGMIPLFCWSEELFVAGVVHCLCQAQLCVCPKVFLVRFSFGHLHTRQTECIIICFFYDKFVKYAALFTESS